MEVTRTQQFNSARGPQTVSITLNDLDLTEQELDPALTPYRATLLDLHAEEYIAMVMYRSGAFHRNEEKNEKAAAVRLTKIKSLRTSIIGARP